MLQIDNLRKTFDGTKSERKSRVVAVDDLSLTVEEGQMFTLLGPSGCGKTTTLRCVAGLEHPDRGEIVVGDRPLFSNKRGIRLAANERGLGMVFQSYAIWPHMNVLKNVSFPLEVLPRSKRLPKKEIRARVERVLAVVQLEKMADRPATNLSGGQQQRLALARALVMEPPLLLLDEPLSNLDAKLREEMRFELKRLQRELNITAVYVTHDQVEALAMSNRIAVMRDGRVEQVGRPREIYERPSSRFVADFIGTSNFIDGTIESHETGDIYLVETPQGKIRGSSSADLPVGEKVAVSIRPEYVDVQKGAAPTSEAVGQWSGVVQTRAFLGESVDHVIRVGELELRARCHPSLSFPPETEVTVTLQEKMCSLIPVGE
ncbi:ABC transporter ATP-binding protein [Actinomadura sp. SCN-SB]|uniref:ABC transporter ATP-binding protein n=1 Tax=Actinomadura sp. SCN-SB TaxID=3373092 RepID=UPI003750427F